LLEDFLLVLVLGLGLGLEDFLLVLVLGLGVVKASSSLRLVLPPVCHFQN
jgi:hypothetical protein